MSEKTYGLWDRNDKSWLGNADGPKTYTDWDICRMAATVVTEQTGRIILPREIEGDPFYEKDALPYNMSAEEAIQKIEGFKEK
jgi:hypothetical protein